MKHGIAQFFVSSLVTLHLTTVALAAEPPKAATSSATSAPAPTKTHSSPAPAADMQTLTKLLTGQEAAGGVPASLSKNAQWSQFVSSIHSGWSQYREKIGLPMSNWAKTEVPLVEDIVVYPFSGPDFVSVQQLFPSARHYVMMAMQNAEQPLDLTQMSPDLLKPSLTLLTSAWEQFGEEGFYTTIHLDFYNHATHVKIGASSFITSFLTLLGYEVNRVVPIRISAKGTIEELTIVNTKDWRSVRIYASLNGKQIMVDYLKLNLANKSLEADPAKVAFIRNLAGNAFLFKAASHLPQMKEFSFLANEVLAHSPLVVQDETGLNYKNLEKSYNTALFGKLNVTHEAFHGYQRELLTAFSERTDIKPLDFRFGYIKDGNYAIIVAKRKPLQTAGELPVKM